MGPEPLLRSELRLIAKIGGEKPVVVADLGSTFERKAGADEGRYQVLPIGAPRPAPGRSTLRRRLGNFEIDVLGKPFDQAPTL